MSKTDDATRVTTLEELNRVYWALSFVNFMLDLGLSAPTAKEFLLQTQEDLRGQLAAELEAECGSDDPQ